MITTKLKSRFFSISITIDSPKTRKKKEKTPNVCPDPQPEIDREYISLRGIELLGETVQKVAQKVAQILSKD